MDATKKTILTKRDYYNTIRQILTAAENTIEIEGEITYESLNEFIDHELALLDNKAAAAQKRAMEKKKEGDILREKVYDTLDDENYMTITEIVAKIDDPDVSAQMVTSRLTQLKKLDLVERESISSTPAEGSKTKKISAYRKKNQIED